MLRIFPLHIFAVGLLCLIVAVKTGFELRDPIERILISVGNWILLSAPAASNINQLQGTWQIIAGVTWSLPYEACFYLLLPWLAIATGKNAHPLVYFCSAVLLVLLAISGALKAHMFMAFLPGMITAWASRKKKIQAWMAKPAAGIFSAASLIAAYGWIDVQEPRLLLLGIGFLPIACGCSLGGVLVLRAFRKLGELSYGIYLMHGMVLFTLLDLFVGREAASQLSEFSYWALVSGALALFVLFCELPHRWIEAPAMSIKLPKK